MKRKPNEKPINFLRRVVKAFDFELEPVLTSLPSIKAILEYLDVLAFYDVGTLQEIQNLIEFENASPDRLRRFVDDWNLSPVTHLGNPLWVVPYPQKKD